MASPFLSLVPKGLEANLEFRERMIREAREDKKLAHELWIMCARDLLFFVNGFCYLYEPRTAKKLPFITYEYQDAALLKIESSIGNNDLVIEKSRDMGASWMCITTFFWRWLFQELQSFLLVSRKEEYVDKTGDPKSLFWKIDFLYQHLPKWMQPSLVRQKLHMQNGDNGSTINGESTTGSVAAGDRRTAELFDEFARVNAADSFRALASTRDSTDCRIFNSTPQGTGTAFYDLTQAPDVEKIRLHWTLHPTKSVDLYFDDKGNARSPWYDRECQRAMHAYEIAQELDISYLSSDYQFFDEGIIDSVSKQHVCPPAFVGDLDYDIVELTPDCLIKRSNGPLKLWLSVDPTGQISKDEQRLYGFGIDISAGTGASNSCISIGDLTTNEKVGEFVANKLRPDEFAKLTIALARFFSTGKDLTSGAHLIWEANGPGRIFGDVLIECGYRNFYYRETETKVAKVASQFPGWYATKDSKTALLADYRKALAEHLFINHSHQALRECREYVYLTESRSVEHARAARTIDPTGARENHGDRVTADALLWRIMKKGVPRVPPVHSVPDESFAMRRFDRLNKMRRRGTELVGW